MSSFRHCRRGRSIPATMKHGYIDCGNIARDAHHAARRCIMAEIPVRCGTKTAFTIPPLNIPYRFPKVEMLNILGMTSSLLMLQPYCIVRGFLQLTTSTRLVIHGYVQSAATVASNTTPLKAALSDIATLHYVDGPPLRSNPSAHAPRPWWLLDRNLEFEPKGFERWKEVVCSQDAVND
jgi:hypothetical protein